MADLKKLRELRKKEWPIVIPILKKLRVPFFLTGGTLLGAIRNNDWCKNDCDIDLGILEEDYRKKEKEIFKAFNERKWKVERRLFKGKPYLLLIGKEFPLRTEIQIFLKWGGWRYHIWGIGEKALSYYTAHLFKPFKTIHFKGFDVSVPNQTIEFLEEMFGNMEDEISLKEPNNYRTISWDKWKELKAQKIGYTFVVADLLHIGHLRHLEKCKEYCDFLIVGVYTDELTQTYKRKPIISFEQRKELIEALKCVDMVVRVENKDATPMLKKLWKQEYPVTLLFHANDWKEVEGKEYIESVGGKLIQPPYTKGISTTMIIKKIKREES